VNGSGLKIKSGLFNNAILSASSNLIPDHSLDGFATVSRWLSKQ
jgi:hypothetical protein